jgi:hypothetical protein
VRVHRAAKKDITVHINISNRKEGVTTSKKHGRELARLLARSF